MFGLRPAAAADAVFSVRIYVQQDRTVSPNVTTRSRQPPTSHVPPKKEKGSPPQQLLKAHLSLQLKLKDHSDFHNSAVYTAELQL